MAYGTPGVTRVKPIQSQTVTVDYNKVCVCVRVCARACSHACMHIHDVRTLDFMEMQHDCKRVASIACEISHIAFVSKSW